MDPRRQEILELETKLQAVKDSSPEVAALLRLLALRFDLARDELLSASPETFPAVQGRAHALHELLLRLTVARTPIPKE